MRERTDARNLGLPVERYRQIKPRLRPKSLFLADKGEQSELSDRTYGDDVYMMPIERLLEKSGRGELLVTATLGDSLAANQAWHGRAIPLDLFPYFAAPFVLDFQKQAEEGGMGVVKYRQELRYLSEVRPQFLGGLESRMRIHQRGKEAEQSMFEDDDIPTDFIELQIHGPSDLDLVSEFHYDDTKPPTRELLKALKSMGIRTVKY